MIDDLGYSDWSMFLLDFLYIYIYFCLTIHSIIAEYADRGNGVSWKNGSYYIAV